MTHEWARVEQIPGTTVMGINYEGQWLRAEYNPARPGETVLGVDLPGSLPWQRFEQIPGSTVMGIQLQHGPDAVPFTTGSVVTPTRENNPIGADYTILLPVSGESSAAIGTASSGGSGGGSAGASGGATAGPSVATVMGNPWGLIALGLLAYLAFRRR